jgi:hypothetical protein
MIQLPDQLHGLGFMLGALRDLSLQELTSPSRGSWRNGYNRDEHKVDDR